MTIGPFGAQDLDAWIGHDTGGIFDFPTEGKSFQYMNLGGSKQIEVAWWHLPFYTWIISGALVLIALILRNTSWDNKLTVLVIGIFATCAYALKDYDLVFHGLQAASYGLVALVAIWLIHAVLTLAPVSTVKAETIVPPPVPPVHAASEAPPVTEAPLKSRRRAAHRGLTSLVSGRVRTCQKIPKQT